MKAKHILLTIVLLLSSSGALFADRELERTEILQIFQQLTGQPQKTWIPAGTIQASHEEYRAPKTTDLNEINNQIKQEVAEYQGNQNKRELTENLQKMKLDAIPFNIQYALSNEYTMTSNVTVRFDGDRFYWEINAISRTDSVKPGKDLSANYMTDQFNLDFNARRIFAWDGEKYTIYSLPVNSAIVDSTGSTPQVVNGPLTAGIIPWGYGHYSYENLAANESSAVEKSVDGQAQIHLTLNNSDGTQMLFVMDPAKDYAVISCLIETNSNAVISKQYSDFQSVSGNWVPATILLERFEAESNRLLARDLWNITAIDSNVPTVESFDVEFENDALIEFASHITSRPVMYRYSDVVNMEALLAERLAFAASDGTQSQNCATTALKYAIGQLGADVNDSQLVQLVTEPSGETSLYAMKQLAEGLGFYCRAVKTDIETLRGLDNCQVILHIPSKKHFVVLESIDGDYVRIIDLANNKFYYRTNINFFGMDWPEGVALIISNQSIGGEFTDIDESELHNFVGASGYTCTRLLQEYNVDYCGYAGGECLGYYVVFYERWGCEPAEEGSCSSTWMYRLSKTPCIEDPYDPWNCTVTGDWTNYYMRACA